MRKDGRRPVTRNAGPIASASARASLRSLDQAWRRLAPRYDPSVRYPFIETFHSEQAWGAVSFDSLHTNLSLALERAPWLRTQAGYAWVLLREAFRFPAEALNQMRVLQTLAAFGDQPGFSRATMTRIAVRETTRFNMRQSGPRADGAGGWKFVVVPFGWDNFVMLSLRAFMGHARQIGTRSAVLNAGEHCDWLPLAKGMLVNDVIEASTALNDAVVAQAIRRTIPWFGNSVISMAEFDDAATRSLWGLTGDALVGHEVAHHLLDLAEHGSTESEIEADRMSIFALASWPRARDTAGLPRRSDGFWTYVSVLLGLMMLITSAAVRKSFTGEPSPTAEALAARLTALSDLVEHNPALCELVEEDLEEVHAITVSLHRFIGDLIPALQEIPHAARATLEPTIEAASAEFLAELLDHIATNGRVISTRTPRPPD